MTKGTHNNMRAETELTEVMIENIERLGINRRSLTSTIEPRNPQDIAPDMEKVWDLEDKFLKAVYLMEQEEQEQVAIIIGEDLPEDWRDNQRSFRDYLNRVGRRGNGVDEVEKKDGVSFWNEVHQNIPGFLSEEDLKWLLTNDSKGGGGFSILCDADSFAPRARLITSMMNSFHAWK